MGIMTAIKANKALRLQKNGNSQEAMKLYEEAFAEGLNDPRYILPYALLMIRDGQYSKAKAFLVKNQKAPGMAGSQRTEMLVYYATCCLRLGDADKGINTLEQQYRKTETGLLYQTLGYLYVEKYDAANRPDFDQVTETAADSEEAGEEAKAEEAVSPRETWEAGQKKAEEFLRKSLEYDDEDPICLDNMGQFIYRALEDKAGAKEWFDTQIESEQTTAESQEENNETKTTDSMFLRVDGEWRKVEFCKILFVEGMKDYVMFHIEGERRPLITHLTMKMVEQSLPQQGFMRVNRSYIVALEKIRSVDRNMCLYIGEEIIRVTDQYKPAFEEFLNSRMPGQ